MRADYRAHQPHLRLCFRELKHGFTISAFSLSMPGIRLILARNHAIMQSRNQADLSGRSYEGSHEAHTPVGRSSCSPATVVCDGEAYVCPCPAPRLIDALSVVDPDAKRKMKKTMNEDEEGTIRKCSDARPEGSVFEQMTGSNPRRSAVARNALATELSAFRTKRWSSCI